MTLSSGPWSSSRSSWSPTSWDSLARPSEVGSSIQPGSSRAVSVKSLASKKLLLAQVAALPRLAPPQRLMFSRAVKAVEATRTWLTLRRSLAGSDLRGLQTGEASPGS